MPYTLVTFHAHPDDESLLTAGTMAKAAAAGHRVVLVVATAGEAGDAAAEYHSADDAHDLGVTRRGELQRSADALGVARVEFLGYRDSGLPTNSPDGSWTAPPGSFASADVEEAAAKLAAILREEEADVLTTYDRHGGYKHPDHIQVHRVGHLAGELAGTPVVLEATINRDLMHMGIEMAKSLGFEIPNAFSPSTIEEWFVPNDEITHAVDVSMHLDRKRSSMQAHESQTTSGRDAGAPRSIALVLLLPDEYFSLAFGTEWFVERGRNVEDPKADDVFASLT